MKKIYYATLLFSLFLAQPTAAQYSVPCSNISSPDTVSISNIGSTAGSTNLSDLITLSNLFNSGIGSGGGLNLSGLLNTAGAVTPDNLLGSSVLNNNIMQLGTTDLNDQINRQQNQLQGVKNFNNSVRTYQRAEANDQQSLQKELTNFQSSDNQSQQRLDDIYQKYKDRKAQRDRKFIKDYIDFQYRSQYGVQ